MPRINRVKKARASKRRRVCRVCGHEIQPGEGYFWWANRIGYSSIRGYTCAAHPPRPSMTAGSPKRGQLLAATEAVEDVLATDFDHDEIKEALDNCAQEIRDVADEYHDSASAMVDGLGHETSQSEEVEDRASELEEVADRIENLDLPEVPNFENPDELEEDEDPDYYQDAVNSWEEWREAVREEVDDLLGEVD